jgi:hypothetical protein
MAIQVAREQEGEDVGTARGDLARPAVRGAEQAAEGLRRACAPLRLVTEGFDIADLQEANALLGELQ